jgi:hypothetical protein
VRSGSQVALGILTRGWGLQRRVGGEFPPRVVFFGAPLPKGVHTQAALFNVLATRDATLWNRSRATKQIVLSVRSRNVSVKDVCDLRGVMDREQAAFGALISLRHPSQPTRAEAASAEFYGTLGVQIPLPSLS